jgi:dihydrofolate reductase
MGKIVVSENISLDGVVQDPTGEEGSKRGSWFRLISDQDREVWSKHLLDEALSAEALLLGRRSDEWFAGPWTSRSGAWADRLNSLPKYVVSSTLDAPKWTNATLVTGDVVAEIAALKERLAGDIVVYGSSQLVHTLMEHDLVDELRLMLYPVVLGTGARLFGETSDSRPMHLTTIATLGDGLAYLTYQRH